MGRISCLLLFATLLCANSVHASTEYYSGEVSYLSPDRSTSFGKTVSLLKREILPVAGTIIETVIQPDQDPILRVEKYVTVFSRHEATNTFYVRGPDKSYSGEVHFEGLEWKWDLWSYDLSLKTGETVLGTAQLFNDGTLEIKKQFFRQDVLIMNIEETFEPLSERQYQAMLNQMTRTPDSTSTQFLEITASFISE